MQIPFENELNKSQFLFEKAIKSKLFQQSKISLFSNT